MMDQREQAHQNEAEELGARWTARGPPRRAEIRKEEVGEGFDAVFDGLWKGWFGALVRLNEFRVLFGDAERVEFLNAVTGGAFLGDIQQVLYDDMTLRLTRLTDPIGKGAKQNLTIRKLPDFFRSKPKLRDDLKQRVKDAVQSTNFARDWRNRRISHSDLTLATSPNAKPLAGFSLQQVQAALDSIHAILNTISKRLRDAEIHRPEKWRGVKYGSSDISLKAEAFVRNVTQLAEAVLYIESLVDPDGSLPITDLGPAGTFLSKLGRNPTRDELNLVFRLRKAARTLKSCKAAQLGLNTG